MAKASINDLIRNQLSGIRKKIGEHEKALRTLKREEKDIRRAARLLSGKGVPAAVRGKRGAGRKTRAIGKRKAAPKTGGRRRRTNWEATIKALPQTFTMDELARSSGARGKSRAYLHQIINRWKKAGVIKSAGRATYEKA